MGLFVGVERPFSKIENAKQHTLPIPPPQHPTPLTLHQPHQLSNPISLHKLPFKHIVRLWFIPYCMRIKARKTKNVMNWFDLIHFSIDKGWVGSSLGLAHLGNMFLLSKTTQV